MAELSMRFLGMAEIEIDGVPVHLDRRNSLALLAYLVLTGRPHSREELATLLAGDIAEDTARKRLRNALADLAEHGFGEFLLASRQSVAFNMALPHALDVRRLDDLVVPGAKADSAGLAWAAERCDRELLAGLGLRDAPSFELWLLSERERRGQQVRGVAERLLEQHVRSGELEAGISLARRLLVVEPWHEGIHRILMRLLARDGQFAAALTQYDRCRDALAEELGVEPQPETTVLHDRLRSGPVAPRHNLPASAMDPAEMVGRDVKLDTLTASLIDPSCRLLTIVGLGGSGKTSLALAAAARLSAPAAVADDHPFADGIMLVNLADIPESDARVESGNNAERSIATAIGFGLGLAFYGKIDRLSQLIAYLESKRMLLILDNMEHLLAGVPALQAILRRAPGVTLLVTSRVPLGVPDEWTQEPGGLPLPETLDEIEHAPASQLFLREARRANAALEPEDWPHIVDICRLTGGLPLALKIAAGWLGPLTCAQIAHELGQGGALLNEPAPNLDIRQASIRSIVSAAYETLPAREQQALSRLAVFPGHFDRQAAEAVGVTSAGLVALSQRSLLERSPRDGYTLHPLVSQYALEQLALESANEAEARGYHAAYFASFVEQTSPALFTSPEAHAALGGEQANVRAAWDWAAQKQDAGLLAQLWEGLTTWHHRAGLHREWTDSLSSAITHLRDGHDDPARCAVLVQLLVAKAESLLWQGDLDGAFPLLEEARGYASTAGMIQLEALISFCEGRLLRFRGGEDSAAAEALQQARALAHATHQQRIEADSLLQLGFAATDSENYRDAETYLLRAEEAYRALGDRLSLARTTNQHGRLSVIRGDYTQAQLSLGQSLHIAQTFGDRFLEGYSHLLLGIACDAASGRHREANVHFERALAIVRQTGDPYLDGNIHRAIGRNALHAGDFPRAERSFNHALERARDVGNTRAINDSLRGLAQLANGLNDHAAAEDRARQALHLSTEQGRQNASAAALLILGQTHERLGRFSDAASAYTQSFNLADALGIPHLRCDATTGLASVSLAAGDTGLAVRYVEEILPYLQRHALAGCEELGWVVRTCYSVLLAAHDSRALDTLRQGAALLERRVTALPQPQRNRYLGAFPDRGIVLQLWFEYVAAENHPAVSLVALEPPVISVLWADDLAGQPPASTDAHSERSSSGGSPSRAHHRPSRARRQKRPRPSSDTSAP